MKEAYRVKPPVGFLLATRCDKWRSGSYIAAGDEDYYVMFVKSVHRYGKIINIMLLSLSERD